MHGCCPNKVCLENLPTDLASSSSIAHKTPVLRNLTIIIIFLFCLICDLNHFSKHRNYSLSHSLHSETLQSIHGISQIFLRDFLWASKGMTFFFFYFNKQQIKYKLKVTKERKTTKQKQQQQQQKNINWEESSRLKANSEVDTSGPFFFFLSLLFHFLFFPLSTRAQSKPKQKKRCREDIYI